MHVLRQFDVERGGRIQLCRGDLAKLEPSDGVDVLVVSAYPNNYRPTSTSVIGALDRRGLSVEALAADKYVDLRTTTSCWLSQPVDPAVGFRQLLCFEPRMGALAAESVGDIFRALVPFVDPNTRTQSVAMPLLATGDMGRSPEEMITAILQAGAQWMETGLPLASLQIVLSEHSPDVQLTMGVFDRWSSEHVHTRSRADSTHRPTEIFVSYAHADGARAVDFLRSAITEQLPEASLFVDQLDIEVGSAWQQKIYDALNQCRRVVAVLTPGYLRSKVCQEEMNIARIRELDGGESVLFPVYALTAELPAHYRVLNYVDCREMDSRLIGEACGTLVATLSRGA
jgi:hypothetical protein